MDINYKHTWAIPVDHWMVRFYMWLWSAGPNDVNFCKLFWGYVFCVPCLIVRGFAFPFITIGRAAASLLPEEQEDSVLSETKTARQLERKSTAQRYLNHI